MASTLVTDLIAKAVLILQDDSHVRWSKQELLGWFNDGQKMIATLRPDSYIKRTTFPCVQGAEQALPEDGILLRKVIRNTDGKSIRSIPIDVLDEQIPNWFDNADSTSIEFYIYEHSDPKVFYLYPAPIAGHTVEMTYTAMPPDIVISDNDWDTDNTTITLNDGYVNPLIDLILYRAFSKDADYSANAQRATMHLQAFSDAIGSKMQGDKALVTSTMGGNDQ